MRLGLFYLPHANGRILALTPPGSGLRSDWSGRLVLGDIIVRLDAHSVQDSAGLFRALEKCKVGQVLIANDDCQ